MAVRGGAHDHDNDDAGLVRDWIARMSHVYEHGAAVGTGGDRGDGRGDGLGVIIRNV
jgi:hypothetical protein